MLPQKVVIHLQVIYNSTPFFKLMLYNVLTKKLVVRNQYSSILLSESIN
jgi:hypothetical protein